MLKKREQRTLKQVRDNKKKDTKFQQKKKKRTNKFKKKQQEGYEGLFKKKGAFSFERGVQKK